MSCKSKRNRFRAMRKMVREMVEERRKPDPAFRFYFNLGPTLMCPAYLMKTEGW